MKRLNFQHNIVTDKFPFNIIIPTFCFCFYAVTVLYPEKGVCADPVDKGAILGEGGGMLPSSDKGRQFATDIAGEKT